MQTFTLPWPSKGLSPNDRPHRMVLARAKKAYRQACGWTAKAQGAATPPPGQLAVHLVFNPPSRRAYDQDNLVASMKSGLDGLADAPGVDDKLFCLTVELTEQVAGTVVVTVGPAA